MSDLSPILPALENSNFIILVTVGFVVVCCCFCYIWVFVCIYLHTFESLYILYYFCGLQGVFLCAWLCSDH